MEVKYITLYYPLSHAVWVNHFMSKIRFPLLQPIEIIGNNKVAIRVASGEELLFKRAKHTNIKYHAIWDCVSNNKMVVTQIDSEANLVDQFTKVLPKEHFKSQLGNLGFEPL